MTSAFFALVCLSLAPAGPTPQGPEKVLTSERSEIVLNGRWRFAPALPGEANPQGDWGLIWAPGDWRKDHGDAPTVITEGSGPRWKTDRNDLALAWYERKITVPSAWKGRQIILNLERASTDAVVLLDGREAASIAWPGGEADLTSLVKPGQSQTLRLKLAATPDQGLVSVLMGVGQVSTQKADLAWRGVMDDIVLASRPLKGRVADVFVQPSFRRKEVALDVELSPGAPSQPYRIHAEMLDEEGRVEKEFQAEAKPGEDGKLRASHPWPNPRLWDLDQPRLYTLRLTVEGEGFRDQVLQRFGFREFWIEGRGFVLNGVPIRLRPTLGYDGGHRLRSEDEIRALRGQGYNIQEIWPNDDLNRGYAQWWGHHVEAADRMGWPLMGPSVHMDSVVSWWRQERWSDPEARAAWLASFERSIKKLRNSPSILIWANSGNNFGHNDDQAPVRIGQSRRNPIWSKENERWTKHHNNGDLVYAALRRLDPTRPFMAHQGGPISDIYTANTYLNLLPLQDREEWLSHWAASGDMPYVAVEFGTPLNCTLLRGRNGFGGAIASEPLVTEYSAMLLGEKAYLLEQEAYRSAIKASHVEGQSYRWWIFEPTHQYGPPFQEVQKLYIRNTWRSWRTWGISGGMIPWARAHGYQPRADAPSLPSPAFQPGDRGLYKPEVPGRARLAENIVHPAGQTLQEVNGATLAWIGGRESKWTEKKHSFWEGDQIEKSLILINDERTPQNYRLVWRSHEEGAERAMSGVLQPAQTLILPIRFASPSPGRRQIKLSAEIGSRKHEDAFPYRVFSPPSRPSLAASLWDPSGRTKPLLAALGVKTVPLQRGGLLVAGQKSLSSGAKPPVDLERHVREGGRLLVMSQDPGWVKEKLGFRISEYASRRMFPMPGPSRLTEGLTEADLSDWGGEATLLEPRPDPSTLPRPSSDTTPAYGWRWGMQGVTASYMIEKPHRAGWTPLLQGEFDLAYSPLMTLNYGKGRVTLCTLDLEDQAKNDPAALILGQRIFREAAQEPLAPRESQVVHVGRDASLLDLVGVARVQSDQLPSKAGLALVGEDSKVTPAQAEAFMAKGGRILFLPRKTSFGPFRVAQREGFAGSLSTPLWPEAKGLSASDLRRRTAVRAWLAEGPETGAGGQLARWRHGKGSAVLIQMNPHELDADKATYLRFTRWRQTRALSQVLAAMGASFEADARFFAPQAKLSGSLPLSGEWEARLTQPEAALGDGGSDPGPSTEALKAVQEGPAQGAWTKVKAPSMWAPLTGGIREGVFRRVVTIPLEWSGKDLTLSLGAVDDEDVSYWNGQQIGKTGRETASWWSHRRVYEIPGSLVRPGRQVLAVRVLNTNGDGGLNGPGHAMSLSLKGFVAPLGFYHPDFRTDWELGDDPYRYYRW